MSACRIVAISRAASTTPARACSAVIGSDTKSLPMQALNAKLAATPTAQPRPPSRLHMETMIASRAAKRMSRTTRTQQPIAKDTKVCETLLPSLTIDAGAIIDFATEHSANLLRTDLYGETPTTAQQERHLHTVAELQTRLTLSFVVTPHTAIKLENLDQAREYVRAYLMPMIDGPGRE
jgi:hypothetical protein